TAYLVLLNQAYRVGERSLVYPMARGTGPLLAASAAILFLGERPARVAVLGALLIIGGAIILTTNISRLWENESRDALIYAAITGVFIAARTLGDTQSA